MAMSIVSGRALASIVLVVAGLLPGLREGAAVAGVNTSSVTRALASQTSSTALSPDTAGLDRTGTPPPPPEDWGPGAPLEGERRPRVDLDRLPPPPAEAGDVLVWIPRVVLLPVHLLLKYGVRYPVVGLLTALEEHHVPERIEQLLTFREGRSSITPTFFADFGLRPSVGLVTVHQDLVREGDLVRAAVTFWGTDWVRVAVDAETPIFVGGSGALGVSASYVSRPDQPYYGEGPDTRQRNRGNFRRAEAQGSLRGRFDLGGLHRAFLSATFREAVLTDGEATTLLSRLEAGAYDTPRGFSAELGRGRYLLVEGEGRLLLDTRAERLPELITDPGSGVLVEPWLRWASSPEEDLSFLRGGGELAGFWDVTGLGHVLATRVRGELIEALGDVELPFTELPQLGGLEHMRGFLPGRFVGESVLLATFSYRYPVWYLVDAELFATFGNAWGPGFQGFDVRRQYLSGGLGLRTTFARATRLELLVALGTDRLDRGFEVASARVALGLVEGF